MINYIEATKLPHLIVAPYNATACRPSWPIRSCIRVGNRHMTSWHPITKCPRIPGTELHQSPDWCRGRSIISVPACIDESCVHFLDIPYMVKTCFLRGYCYLCAVLLDVILPWMLMWNPTTSSDQLNRVVISDSLSHSIEVIGRKGCGK